MTADGFREIELWGEFRGNACFQDFTRLLFHGPAVTCGADSQFGFDGIVEAADG